MESPESKTPGSCWEVSPSGSKWLADNLKEMDQRVKRMLNLIEEDGFEANDEATCQRKPELIANVEGFHQLYRSLAERCDHMTKELCKSASTTGSGDSGPSYDQETPDVKVRLHKSGDQSSGLDLSPGSPGADSVFSLKEGSESASLSSSDSDSESFVTSYLRIPLSINSQSLHQKMTELEAELSAVKDKLLTREADYELEKGRKLELKGRVVELEALVLDSEYNNGMLVGELEVARNSLMGLEEEIAKLKRELIDRTSEGNRLKNQLELAWEERASFETQLGSEKELVLELEEMIVRYNADLSDRDLEVWELKVAQRDVEEQFLLEKAQLHSDLLSLSEKQAQLENELKEWELKTKELQDRTLMSESEKIEMQRFYDEQVMALQDQRDRLRVELAAQTERIEVLNRDFDQCKLKYDTLIAEKEGLCAKVDDLMADLSARDNYIHETERYLSQFRKQHDKLVDEYQKARELIGELKPRVEELQSEVDRQRVVISDGAEEKREAIRQLCFSLDHYRSGYQELRQAFVGNRRNVVIAA